jgi:recombination protein RecA
MDKSRRLQQTLWDLQQRWGQNVLDTLGKRLASPGAIPTGFPALDQLLAANGIPRGRISELIGVPTAGVTSLTHRLIASIQASEETAAYIDLGGTFDPDYAARCGVLLDKLLIARPHAPTQALEIARDLVRAGNVALVVVDLVVKRQSGLAAVPSLSVALRRLHEPVAKSRCAVLFLLPAPHAALDPYTHTRLRMERQGWLYRHADVCGYQTLITILQDKGQAVGQQVTVEMTFTPGVEGGDL